MLQNKQIDCSIHGLNFNSHSKAHIARAAQEGIVFSFKYGMDIMNEMGIDIDVIRAGSANMFLSPVFRDPLSGVTGTVLELFDTNGAVGCLLYTSREARTKASYPVRAAAGPAKLLCEAGLKSSLLL